jgi:adenine deaminase
MRKELLRKARGLEKVQLVLKNCKIINVYTNEIEFGDIAIEDGMILGTGFYKGILEHDMKGLYVAPGLIDGHVHIESSMVTPPEFAKLVVPFGTTTVIADPHEIANVSGIEGIKFMLDSSEQIPLNVYMMIPSCVPATKEDMGGASISVYDIKSLLDHPRVIGLGEVMDYPAVIEGDPEIHQKIELMKKMNIDGHAPDVTGYDLNAYLLSGIMTDHECTKVDAMIERIRKGMYVHLREGSATKNTLDLLKGVKHQYLSRLLFCTDDKHPEDIGLEGHINFNVNLAISTGIDPIDAIKIATINAATCYHLKDVGAIAPGKFADLIVFDNLKHIVPSMVYKKGVLVAKSQKSLFKVFEKPPMTVLNTVRINPSELNFDLFLRKNKVRVIGLIEHNVTTNHLIREVILKDGKFDQSSNPDLLKIAVIERHHNTNQTALGLVHDFGHLEGAIAMTIAHDSHNLVVIGSDDNDMKLACKRIYEIQGGIVIVKKGKIQNELELEVSGIMTNKDSNLIKDKIKEMKEDVKLMGLSKKIDDPFLLLAFLSLPVIPKLKLTYRGLFDVEKFKLIDIEYDGI